MNKNKNQRKKDDISKHLTIIKIKTQKDDGLMDLFPSPTIRGWIITDTRVL